MFLVFSLVLLVVAMGILTSVYSVFFPFMQNLGNVSDYHMAYYGAISSVERAELVLRYRSPGFIGSGGFTGNTNNFGPLSDYTTGLISSFDHGLWWTIDSRTPLLSGTSVLSGTETYTIPGRGRGNVDPMVSDDSNHNQIGYLNLETFLLSYDDTTNPNLYYTGGGTPIFFSDDRPITGVFRLPLKIYNLYGKLCFDNSAGAEFDPQCDPDGDGLYDDAALSWSMEGLYKANGFKIFPTMSAFYFQSTPTVNTSNDNVIRESIINQTGSILFENTFTPIDNGSAIGQHNVVAEDAFDIGQISFRDILKTSADFSDLRLSFGAANLFRTATGIIYPYLEYQFSFHQPIADIFYTIAGHSRIGDYDVQILLKKPTVEGTVGGDFTVIF